MPPLAGYGYSSLITANTSTLAANCTNIPLAHFVPDMTGKRLEASYYDVVPCLMDGTTIPEFYLEAKSDAASVLHVEWPTLTAGQAALQLGYINIGKADATNQSDEAGTFSSLRGRWSCADASGNILDSTANDLDMTNSNVDYGATGVFGNAMDFEQADLSNMLEVLDANDPTAYTMTVWIKPETVDYSMAFARRATAASNSPCLGIGSGGCVFHRAFDTAVRVVDGSTAMSAGNWYHLAATGANDGFIRAYVNGAEEGTALAFGTLWTGADRYNCGGNCTDIGMTWFDGIIDEVRLYMVQQTASWIKAEYMAGANTLFTYGAWVAAGGEAQTVYPAFAGRTPVAYAVTGQPGAITALPGLASRLAEAFAATGVPGAITALAAFAERSPEAFGATAVVGAVTVSPEFAARVAAAYAPTAQPGSVTVLPAFAQRTATAWEVTAHIAGAGTPYYYLMLVANRQGRN